MYYIVIHHNHIGSYKDKSSSVIFSLPAKILPPKCSIKRRDQQTLQRFMRMYFHFYPVIITSTSWKIWPTYLLALFFVLCVCTMFLMPTHHTLINENLVIILSFVTPFAVLSHEIWYIMYTLSRSLYKQTMRRRHCDITLRQYANICYKRCHITTKYFYYRKMDVVLHHLSSPRCKCKLLFILK